VRPRTDQIPAPPALGDIHVSVQADVELGVPCRPARAHGGRAGQATVGSDRSPTARGRAYLEFEVDEITYQAGEAPQIAATSATEEAT